MRVFLILFCLINFSCNSEKQVIVGNYKAEGYDIISKIKYFLINESRLTGTTLNLKQDSTFLGKKCTAIF